jgi:16S rRNA (cytosine1402-N4)-methyltransferase
MMAIPIHTPVALDRTVELLAPALNGPEPLMVDLTLGLAGHAEAILDAVPDVQLLGMDRDTEALAIARERLARFGSRVTTVHARYDELPTALESHYPGRCVDAVLLDAGVSSLQLDRSERGFSYLTDAALDMRMNPEEETTAADLVNTLSRGELQTLFQRFGDEPLAARYAKAIVTAREERPLRTTLQLVDVIDRATLGGHPRGGHNAKRVFQALRIAVNHELESLAAALPAALDALCVGGRIVVLSYQSGEDRVVKHGIDARTRSHAPLDLPVIPESDQPTFRWLVKSPEGPLPEEAESNPRSRSLRLRAAEKIRKGHVR